MHKPVAWNNMATLRLFKTKILSAENRLEPNKNKTIIMSGRQRSDVWSYFSQKENVKAVCNICKAEISFKSTITNLKSHLKRKHNSSGSVIPLESETATINTESAETIPQPNVSVPVIPSASSGQNRVKRQRTIGSYIAKEITSHQKNLIDRDLLDLFVKEFHPFSIVEEPSFRKVIKWIPGYELPSRKTISTTMIPALYQSCVENVRDLVSREAISVCLTIDCWTSANNENYMATTAHFITEGFTFKTVLLKCSYLSGSHTAVHLAEEIKNIILEWNLEGKVNYAISDNATNITKALADILSLKHYGCYAHSLNLIVQRALKELEPTLEKIKKIVTFFKRSSLNNEKLLKFQINSGVSQPKRLIQDVSTRWNSTFYMLRRFIELKEAIRATIALVDRNLPVLTGEEWKTCKEVCNILSPFEEMTNSMSGEKYMTGSAAIVVTPCLKGVCERFARNSTFSAATEKVVSSSRRGLTDRFGNIEKIIPLAICTLLDPRYKHHVFQDDSALSAAKTFLENLTIEMIEKNTNEIMGDKQPQASPISRAKKEIESYFQDDILPRRDDDGNSSNVLNWWKTFRHIYPNLVKIFRFNCNIVATSVPCERIFSKAGNLISEKRTRLSSEKVELILFLNANLESSDK
ncbi:E3 SUMO-protein ligase ZBED1-like [Hermetia illucens]|uniref:E3 SUMO-protein ligase ZBED1-like n=1 Tax=Hermetia illucens TaxID=343691 RepID=UPI0018CC2476|nr:E3 SUMO-protein ligase ZBED1-like [Hermetia illucens]